MATPIRIDVEDKLQCPAWSPASYRQGCPARTARAVLAVSCLVLDYDYGSSLDEMQAPWRDWPHVLHTSWSHTDRSPKARVIVPLEVPISGEDWARAWRWAHARDSRIDPACKDPSRIYFVPVDRPQFEARIWKEPIRFLRIDLPDPDPPPRRIPPDPYMRTADRLKEDPDLRTAHGLALGGRVVGDRIEGVLCPQCGRGSIWWPIAPIRNPRALCSHRRSCGWSGWLDTLP